MIPLQLQVKNFMSYRTATTVDFRGIRTACLSGDNGAGKSALLEAMTWAIWGRSRASSGRDVVTIGESQVEVTFDFALGDREYRIYRRQTAGARLGTALELYVRGSEEEDWLTITGDSVRQTEQAINATLRIDYETFVNSAFLMQGQADAFTQKRPAERKRVLAEILNLGDYDELSRIARDEERAARARLGHTGGQIERLEQELEKRPDAERELELLSERLVTAGELVDALEADSRLVQEALSALSALIHSRNAAAARVERTNARLAELDAQDKSDRKSMASLRRLLDRGESIELDYRELLEHRKVLTECTQILRHRQPVEARLREVEREIERARADVERRLDRCRQSEQQSLTALATLAERERELESLRDEISRAGDIDKLLDVAQRALRDAEREMTTLESECKALKESMNEIKSNMDLLATGEAECPICRRPMADGEHEHIAAIWRAEGTRLGDQFRDHRERIRVLDDSTPRLTAAIAEHEALKTAVSRKQAVASRLEGEVSQRSTLEAELHRARKQADALQATLASRSFATEHQAESKRLCEQLDALTLDSESMAASEARVAELADIEDQYLELQTARVRYANYASASDSRSQTMDELRRELDALQVELAEANEKLQEEPAIRSRLQTIGDELERARAERDQLQAQFGAASDRIEHLDRLADERDRLRAQAASIGQDADVYRELGVAFGRNGIQAMIVETVLPELEDEANRLLTRMTTSHLHVRFRSTREAVSTDNVIETLDIIIRDESGERPYALYSGGEAFRVDFAIRVALSKLLVRRAGTTIDMLIIDEGFGTQDARGRDGLIEALQSVEADFATILVITHIDEVRDMFPTRIEVSKNEAGSYVTVV